MARRTLRRSHAILLAAALVALAAFNLVRVMQEPPSFYALLPIDAVLDKPIDVQHATGRRSMRSPYAILSLDGKRATIENLCFLWECDLSPALAALHAGDQLHVWIAGDEIWQVNHDGELLLDYRQALDAHRRAATRQEWVNAGFVVAIVAILAWLWWHRRGPLFAGSASVSSTGEADLLRDATMPVSLRLGGSAPQLPSEPPLAPAPHMLNGAGLERFSEARARRDRDAMITALVQAGASEAAARMAVDTLLAEAEARYS